MIGNAKESHPLKDDWDAHWNDYATAASQNPAQDMRHNIIGDLLAASPCDGGRRIFDIGSGQGDLIQKLEERFPDADFLGVELSESGVEISRRKARSAKFLVADLARDSTKIPEHEGWATEAVCSEVLEHLDDPEDFLKKIRKYLEFNARLIVTVPGGPMSAFDSHIGHRQHFTKSSIGNILEKSGFEIERIYLAGFPFFNLYRLIVIARGEKLASDVSRGSSGLSSKIAAIFMRAFGILFHFNLDSPFGWQVIAVARKTKP
jgi:SAM-dependent methyltransferase